MPDTTTRPWFCPRDETCPSGSHDTYSAYRYGCRSPAARVDRGRYTAERENGGTRRASSVSIMRRIEACHYMGWSGADIALELGGLNRHRVTELRNGQVYVRSSTLARMGPVLERLAMTPPPETPTRKRTRTWGRKRGYRHLLDWNNIDDPNERPYPAAVDLASRRRLHPMDRTATVEIDEHLLEHVLDPLSATKFTELSVPEQDHVVERLWRDAVADGYEFPGRRVAERLEVNYREVETVRRRVFARRARERKAS